MESQIGIQVLGNICQLIATIMAIYMAVFIFVLGYLFNNKISSKKESMNKVSINILIISITIFLLIINYYFVFPSLELGLLTYFPIIFISAFIFGILYFFNKNNRPAYLEKGTILLSTILAFFSFILGFYIIISCITPLSYISSFSLYDTYVFKLIKLSRMFLVVTLDSLIYLISFILIHKNFILKTK